MGGGVQPETCLLVAVSFWAGFAVEKMLELRRHRPHQGAVPQPPAGWPRPAVPAVCPPLAAVPGARGRPAAHHHQHWLVKLIRENHRTLCNPCQQPPQPATGPASRPTITATTSQSSVPNRLLPRQSPGRPLCQSRFILSSRAGVHHSSLFSFSTGVHRSFAISFSAAAPLFSAGVHRSAATPSRLHPHRVLVNAGVQRSFAAHSAAASRNTVASPSPS